MTAEYHLHSYFSGDSSTPPREQIERGLALGLKTMCFTDHHDADYPYDIVGFEFDTDAYFRELTALREEYRGRMDVRIGVEIGLQTHLGEYYTEYLEKYPFDFVIGSLHLLNRQDPYYGELFQDRADEEIYREYFASILENIQSFSDFDVVGHIDYIIRYGKKQDDGYSYEKYADLIDKILTTIVDKGLGIELNTAGFKYGLKACHPHPDIIKRYRELGGEIITVGSDAHRPEHIAYDFDKALEILKHCGFRYRTEFRERRPEFVLL